MSEQDFRTNVYAGTGDVTLHESSREMLKQIQECQLPMMPITLSSITTKKFRNFYNKTSKKTSSSPSGLHMGHWKAASKNEVVSEILVSIIKIAIENSYALVRWRKVVGVLLEKQMGYPYVHKFQTIH